MFIELIGAVIVCEKIDLFSVFPLFKSYLTVESVFSGVFFQYFSVGGVIWGDTFFIKDALQKIKNSHIQISSEGMIHFAIAFVAELFFKNDLLQGIGLMLLLVFAIGAVLFLIQRHKENTGAHRIQTHVELNFHEKEFKGKCWNTESCR